VAEALLEAVMLAALVIAGEVEAPAGIEALGSAVVDCKGAAFDAEDTAGGTNADAEPLPVD